MREKDRMVISDAAVAARREGCPAAVEGHNRRERVS